jgi:hypothetical protein
MTSHQHCFVCKLEFTPASEIARWCEENELSIDSDDYAYGVEGLPPSRALVVTAATWRGEDEGFEEDGWYEAAFCFGCYDSAIQNDMSAVSKVVLEAREKELTK